MACPVLESEQLTSSSAARATANEFLNKWIEAWNHHDAEQLGLLQTSDANTVNRFGTLVEGRAAVQKALGFLHNPGGPYHDVTAPPLQLLDVRQIAPTVIILQASWKSPVMNPDGKLNLPKEDDMLVSSILSQPSGKACWRWVGSSLCVSRLRRSIRVRA